jgi:hypothetical protein
VVFTVKSGRLPRPDSSFLVSFAGVQRRSDRFGSPCLAALVGVTNQRELRLAELEIVVEAASQVSSLALAAESGPVSMITTPNAGASCPCASASCPGYSLAGGGASISP